MVRITEEAAKLLARSLEETPTEEGQTLRLVQEEDAFALVLDQEREEDQVVHHDGKPILVASPQVGDTMGDVTVDAVVLEEGAQLVLREG